MQHDLSRSRSRPAAGNNNGRITESSAAIGPRVSHEEVLDDRLESKLWGERGRMDGKGGEGGRKGEKEGVSGGLYVLGVRVEG